MGLVPVAQWKGKPLTFVVSLYWDASYSGDGTNMVDGLESSLQGTHP